MADPGSSNVELVIYIFNVHIRFNGPTRKETAELHIFTNCDLLHKKSWSNFVIDIFHGQTLALVHETCWLTSENFFSP